MTDSADYRVWVEISKDTINQNLVEIRRKVFPSGIYAVLKANAYGLGATKVAENIDLNLVDGLCVANFDEAVDLIHLNKQVHILGGLLNSEIEGAILHNIVITIISLESAFIIDQIASRLGRIAECHVKIDTGMGRLGILHTQAIDVIHQIFNLKNIICTGIFSHFANAYNLNDFTYHQVDLFRNLLSSLDSENLNFKYVHFANSDANNNYSDLVSKPPFNYVRTGLNLYGYVDSGSNKNIDIFPALSLKTRLISMKEMPKGSSIGYGSKYVLPKRTWIGVISIGYADGLPLNMTNRGFVIVNDTLCPMIGRISMDYTTISLDSCDINLVERGQEVICLGESESHSILLENWAQIKGTHPYDIMCSLGQRVKKVFK